MKYYIIVFALFLVTGLMMVTSSIVWHRRRSMGADLFFGLALSATIWTAGHALELLAGDLPEKILWARVQYFGIVASAPFWLMFCIAYTRQESRLRGRLWGLIWIFPIITLALVWTNEIHHLIWSNIRLVDTAVGPAGLFEHGAFFWIHVVYSYALMVAGYVVLARAILRAPYLYRRQGIALLIGISIPWLGNALYLAGFTLMPGLDLTPIALLITTLILGWSLLRHHLLEVAPVGRDALMDAMLDSILVLDQNRRIADLNAPAAALFEMKREAALGQPISALLPEIENLYSPSPDAKSISLEIELKRPTPISLEVRSVPLWDARSRSIGGLLILRDITQRKAQDQAMRIQSVALEAVADGIVITNPHGEIVWVNPAFTQMTGYTQEEVSGQNARILKSGRQDNEFYQRMWQTIRNRQIWRGELINQRKDGAVYPEQMAITPVLNSSGEIYQYIAIKQNISERKAAEEALERSNWEKGRLMEAEAIAQERNRIAQEIHDGLAQTLAALRMRISRWRQYLDTSPDKMRIEIEDVEDMVNTSLREARRSIYALRPLALANQSFLEALRGFVKGFSEYYGLDVTLDVEGREECIPKHLELALFRVVQEALNNTAKHSAAQQAHILLTLDPEEGVRLQINDDGQGFDTGQLRAAERDGHIGLQTMRERVLAAGGTLRLESRRGAGTVVHITFPNQERPA